MTTDVLKVIHNQILAANDDLLTYQPREINWKTRAFETSKILVPWLIEIASGIKNYVEGVLNAPALLRIKWAKIRPYVDLPLSQINEFDQQLSLDDVLRESVTGELVSNVVSKFLLENHPEKILRSNGRSDYPDLYISTIDYSLLPSFRRMKSNTTSDEYGAAIKGKEARPVRVPDGLEIKTCRDRIAVDCHHPHAGLHLALVFNELSRQFVVDDIKIAF